MKRCEIFRLVPAVGLPALMSPLSAAPVPAGALVGKAFAISVQCWSFKQFTLFDAIQMAAAAGAGAVEVFPTQKIGGPLGDGTLTPALGADGIKAIRDHAEAHAIALVNFGVTGIPSDEAGARQVFEFAKAMGLYGITTESLDAIGIIENLCKEYDIKVGFHNHPKRPNYVLWDPDHVFAQVKNRDPRVGICADTGHWASSGLDPAEVVKKVASRVVSFHMKDRASMTGPSHDRPFGTGILDLPAMLDAVRPHGFAGNVSIEYEHNWDKSLPEVAQCVGYLRAYAKTRTIPG